ncbi:MAG: YCF48-related protein [Candidatus Thorarchaeota archaeon]
MKLSVIHLVHSKTHMVTIVILCILLTPLLTDGLVLSNSDSHPSQADTIWEEIDHDYIRDDAMGLDIVFRNATHGWALSQNKTGFGDGIILHSNDSGLSWQLQFFNETMRLRQIQIVNEHIWVTGNGVLLHSINDGRSWEYVPIGDELGLYYGIFFFNETLGWTESEWGLFKTEDAGETWSKTRTYPYESRASDIHFTTPQDGWIIHGYGIYHSSDGGDTWEKQHSKGGWSFSFVSDTEAWAVGDNMLAHMTDGVNWIEQSLPSDAYGRAPYLTGVQFLSTSYGWITGSRPLVGHTQNGGVDWYEQSVTIGSRYNAVYFFNESLGWAIGWDCYIIRTTRGNQLGVYGWGSSGTVIGYTAVAIAIVVVVSLGLLLLKRKRRGPDSPPTIT